MSISRLLETYESFVTPDLTETNRAWSAPIEVVEYDGRRYEITLQSKLISDEYGKVN